MAAFALARERLGRCGPQARCATSDNGGDIQIVLAAQDCRVDAIVPWIASVPGASGTWKDLTENVNQLAATLTTQLRAISDVATAVTKGDLTRSITVEAQGEVAQLKDTIERRRQKAVEPIRTDPRVFVLAFRRPLGLQREQVGGSDAKRSTCSAGDCCQARQKARFRL